MKLLDKYILTTYLKTFFSVFVILMLIFLLQSIWLYISELAGKDLEIDVILKFLIYVSPRLIVLVLPLTILLASIMVFGSFAENYEFAAMKSTGISLQRAMRSLAIFISFLAIITYFFANNVIPWAEFNFYNLRKNLAKVKPAMVIAEGQFNQIGNINIKVEEKSGDRGQFLSDVVIHQKKPRRLGNFTVIKSKTGELTSAEDDDILQLVLYDGNYYDAIQPDDFEERQRRPHVKSSFEKYTLNIDLSQINNVDLEERNTSTRYSMLTAQELDYTIDTLKLDRKKDMEELATSLYNRSTAPALKKNIKRQENPEDPFTGDNIYELLDPKKNVQLIDAALNTVNSTNAIIMSKKRTFDAKEKNVNKHIISFYEKFALGFACIILFFVGAPLGALIRKGGFGLPIVIAIVLFLTYHFIGIFAKNSAEDSSLNPIVATWLSTGIMLPLSIYLTNRATKDRSLINLDGILVPLKRLITRSDEDEYDKSVLDQNSEDFKSLKSYSNEQLIDLIKNYRQYDMPKTFRNTGIAILETRGISEDELRFGGNLFNEDYENALRHKKDYDENSRIAMLLYWAYIIFGIGGAVLNNNGFPAWGKVLIGLGAVLLLMFLFAMFKAFTNQTNFYKIQGINRGSNIIIAILLGIPLFFIYNWLFGRKMKDDLKQIT